MKKTEQAQNTVSHVVAEQQAQAQTKRPQQENSHEFQRVCQQIDGLKSVMRTRR